MFVLRVAAELYGRKHNVEIGFPHVPPLDELCGHAEAVFLNEARRLRRSKADPLHQFALEGIKIFDDAACRWRDLENATQLTAWSQLYLVQTGEQRAKQSILEPPIRIRSPLSTADTVLTLFQDMDFGGKHHVSVEEVQRIFNVMCLYAYSEERINAMFHKFDANRDGLLSAAEFSRWLSACPEVSQDLMKRSEEYWLARKKCPTGLLKDSSSLTSEERLAITQCIDRTAQCSTKKDSVGKHASPRSVSCVAK